MAYLLQLIEDLSGQSVVMWSSIIDPAVGAMSGQEGDQRKEMCRSQILLCVKVYNAKSELTRGSDGDRATGGSDTYSGLDIKIAKCASSPDLMN